ncbi:hypothetical protein Glo7428_2172 [Gloeocapsa sp. PCC 7428]|uniref:hypothetical protein n=1 Tax=Gloeocapsa sp. PCC 7428 TaxID=1173026 RepID=UPI0002A5F91E|nr:hypothetical protein [Gloeocapsa sp. PCC 7428]AFZ30693.1 hypothetical protein Glo7428_2172 [Gloeocapsa sp. PCC 7428]
MNMELTQRENYVAEIVTSSRVEAIEDLLSTPVSFENEIAIVNQALCSTNHKLQQRVTQLEQALVEFRKNLQIERERSQTLQTQVAQKIQELETAQEQIKRLKQEQQINQQTTQQQQILIEGLTVQLQASQERVNQIEHEWLLTQATYNEQTYQLRQSESKRQDLHSRLMREQDRRRQLQAALDKCFDQSSNKSKPATDTEGDRIFTYTVTRDSDIDSAPNQARFAQAQPIPPWSVHAEEVQESKPETEVFTTQTFKHTTETPVDETLVETFIEQFPEAIATLGKTAQEQHDAVLNLLSDTSANAVSQKTVEVTEASDYETLTIENLSSAEDLESSATTSGDRNTTTELNPESDIAAQSESVAEPTTELDELLTWEETEFFANPNWPSPIVNPSRVAKKRKTLAAIELPNFAHSR